MLEKRLELQPSAVTAHKGIPFTVGEFLPVLQDKTALVFIPGHALVIDHGVMVDWFVQTADAPVMFLLVVQKL